MKETSLKLISILAFSILVTACSSDDDESTSVSTPVSFLGDSVTVANTFEDAA